MYSENQIAELIKKNPQAVVKALEEQDISVEGITSKGIANTGSIENTGDIEATGDISGSSLSVGTTNINELFVKIMDAPESTTLTQEQINKIINGVFINGDFLGCHNPVLFPAFRISYLYCGLIICPNTDKNLISCYVIDTHDNGILIQSGQKNLELNNLGKINEKSIPNYPSNTGTFTLKMVNGNLTWVQDA